MSIPVVVQHRHVHVSAADEAALFGSAPEMLTKISHEGQSVYRETVTIVGKRGELEGVRVIGPARETSQVELSATDAFALGFDPPVRVSGDNAQTLPCVLRGPKGEVRIETGVIIPVRHLHCAPQDAERLKLKHLDVVTVAVEGRSGSFLDSVVVRVHPTFACELHLTEDEASEAWIQTGDRVVLQ